MTLAKEAAPKPPPDLRLLGAAAGSWIGALGGGRLPLLACWLLVGAALCGGVCAGWRGSLRRRAIAIGLILLAAGFAVAAVGREAHRSGPVADLARRSGVAHVELTLSDDPRPLPITPHVPPSVLISAKIKLLDADGRRWSLSQPVLVIAPAASWSRFLPSTRVATSATFAIPDGNDVAALLITHSKPTVIRRPTAVQRWGGQAARWPPESRCRVAEI